MTFLEPLPAIIAASAAVPLLVLLYFLKLKRREQVISSTLLWKRAVQDLQVNAPFQRIRRNILLLLQLLAMAVILAALGRPVASLDASPPKRHVLLIDRSASMNATDAAPSRLEQAKQRARELVNNLRGRMAFSLEDASDQAMVVAFDEHPKVLCNFTSDKKQLLAAIDAVRPTDGPSLLGEAVTVARAFASSPGAEANNRSVETPGKDWVLDLFSDGQIADLPQINVAAGEMNFHRVGSSDNNIAVTAMQARRMYEKPAEIEVFATLTNFGPQEASAEVQLSLDGGIRSVRAVQVPGRKPSPKQGEPPLPGTVSVSFSLTHQEGCVVEVRQLAKDALASDDAAWAVVPPPKSLAALLVTSGNVALLSALKACPLAKLDTCTPAEFEKMDHAAMSASPPYDVIVLDRCAAEVASGTNKLPRGRFIVFGAPPPESGATAGAELTNQQVVDRRLRHPILQYVNLNNLFASKAVKLTLPNDATVLAEFAGGPAMAIVRREGSVFLLAPFDCMDTNWPFEPAFVMFCYNATGYLGTEVGQEQQFALRVNQAISVEHVPAGATAKITPPDGKPVELPADPSGAVRFPATGRVGIYKVEIKDRPAMSFAVNLLDVREANIAPAGELSLTGQTVAAQLAIGKGNLELWPALVMACLVLVLLEWLVYNLKVRL